MRRSMSQAANRTPLVSGTEPVCPRCGNPAQPEQEEFCVHYGLNLANQYALPSLQEWLARQEQAPGDQPTSRPAALTGSGVAPRSWPSSSCSRTHRAHLRALRASGIGL